MLVARAKECGKEAKNQALQPHWSLRVSICTAARLRVLFIDLRVVSMTAPTLFQI